MVEVCGTNGMVSVKFDNGDAITLGSASTIKTKDGSYFAGSLYPYDTYVLSSSVNLTVGRHTVTVSLNGDSKGAAADYIKLTKMTEPSGISISTSTTLNVGESANITLNGVNTDNMYMVTYSSDNESVATVDGNGKITATGAGTATIEVLVKKYVISEGVSAQAVVTVNTSDVLYISDAKASNGTFTAKITKNSTLKDTAKAFIVVYEHNNIKSVKTVDIGAGTGTQSISEALTTAAGDIVEIFVWYMEDMEPVCKPVCVKVK
ncbi:MAG: Ig-like domain-containing protein [Clostridia bacterium]|nr:Ig-like domain-containing protein [Clostridia bacterium]